MDIGVRAAQLISEVTPHIFLTAAQVTLQQHNSTRPTPTNSTPSQVKSEICEPFDTSGSAMSAVERDNTPESSEDEENAPAADAEEFEVEQILDTKMSGRKRLFKVRWKNYGPEYDTWEPEEMLKDGAEESMKEFMIKYEAEKKNSKNSKKRKRPSATPTAAAPKPTRSRSRRSTVEDADDESLPDTVSSSDGEGFTPSSKKKSKPNTNGKTPTPSRNRSGGRTTSPTKPSNERSTPSVAAASVIASNGLFSNVRCSIL
uniref:Chromo domain-containing protein n=1 Tax=Panagrolaimus superbus TaxID=310955 RepID=A0A914YYK9_9BILA